jgi:hypothetical protein
VTGGWGGGSGLSGERITFVSESRSFFGVSFVLQLQKLEYCGKKLYP